MVFVASVASADYWETDWMKEGRGVEPPPKVCQMLFGHDWPTREALDDPAVMKKEAEFNKDVARELAGILRSHDNAVRERTCPEFFPNGFLDTAGLADKIFSYLKDADARPEDIGSSVGEFRALLLADYQWRLADLRADIMGERCGFSDCIGGIYGLVREAMSSGDVGWNFKPVELGLLGCEVGETCTRDDFVKLANAGPQKE